MTAEGSVGAPTFFFDYKTNGRVVGHNCSITNTFFGPKMLVHPRHKPLFRC
jgi:hypothetical protein